MLNNFSEKNKISYNRIIFLLIVFTTFPNHYTQTLTAEKIYKNVSDAVVVIYAYDSNDKLSSQGSGVVINDKGYIVTNYHVLAGNDRLEVLHNNETVPYVDIIGIDVVKDILILKIEEKKFPAIKIGDSKSLNIGQRIYAIGSPLGFENTISEGIISGLRSYEEVGKNFIQITASISSGSSGGAVVNDKGELIGISTLTAKAGQNINFAIPIDEVLNVEIGSYSKNEAYKNFELFSKGNDAAVKGNYQEAIKYFTSYIKKYPNNANAYYNRGIAKANLEDYRDAIKDYNKAIEINPNDANVFHNRGNAKSDLQDYRGAVQDYNKAIEIEPNKATAFNNRGIAKANLEDYRGSIQDFNKSIEINPNYANAYYNRGNTKFQLENYRDAIQDFTKSLEINLNNVEAFNNRGLAKINLADYKGSIQDFTKSIEIDPNNIKAYMYRGLAKYSLEDKFGACLDWSKAGELGNDDAYDLIKENCN
jgi:tetratricopeptide (TPR) repeat protein